MYQLKAGDNLLIIANKLEDVDSVKVDKENVNITSKVASEINSIGMMVYKLKSKPFVL